nr:PREDICTED: rho GTPase-activating protein 9 [Lepisosteus oculatus]
MLSGSWRKTALPSAARGGSVVLEAQYDYSYRATDGRQVSMREGERFVLLRKANDDWWQVRRMGAPPKSKPIYVPATYVTEVQANVRLVARASLTPCSQSPCPAPARTFCRSMEDLNSTFRGRGAGGHFPTLPFAGPPPSSSSGHLLLPPDPSGPMARSKSSSMLPQNPYQEPEAGGSPSGAPHTKSYSQGDIVEAPRRHSHLQLGAQPYIPRHSLLESPLYSSRRLSEPPSPTQRPLQVLDLWEQHLDPVTGRCFYVNSVTRERSWKPPRRAKERAASRVQPCDPAVTGSGRRPEATVTRQSSAEASPFQGGTFPRDSNQLSSPSQDSGNGSLQKTSRHLPPPPPGPTEVISSQGAEERPCLPSDRPADAGSSNAGRTEQRAPRSRDCPERTELGDRLPSAQLPMDPMSESLLSPGSSPVTYIYSVQDADSSWELSQNIQRAASSDALNSAPFSPTEAQLRNSSALPKIERLNHARSMILTEQSEAKMAQHRRNMSHHVLGGRGMEPLSPISSPDSSESTTPELEKAGMLNKTKIAEGGRKLRKNWNASWVVLVGNSLVFFKDPKTQTPSTWVSQCAPWWRSLATITVQPCGCVLYVCLPDCRSTAASNESMQQTSSETMKCSPQLRTVTGNEFLLQSETDSVIREWYSTIQSVIDRLDRENPLDNVLLYSLRRAGSTEILDHSGDEDDIRASRKSSSVLRSTSSAESSEKKRVKSRLKKLILKRPPLQALQEKGLIKEQVFGCRLDALCEREKSSVPKFVRLCAEAVEKRGLETDGIYRVSGNLAVIQKLRFKVDHERAVTTDGRYLFPEELVQEEKLNLDDSEWEDIHVITGALKMFFRELPEPLIPYSFFNDFVETVKIPDYMEKVERMKCLVKKLPPPNHDTLNYILQHLKRVMEQSDINRMTTQNIGIVFGPTLMRPERDNSNIAINMVYQNQVVELILSEYSQIFGPERPDFH